MLLRVLPALYEKQPQPINLHLRELVALMAQLDQAEQHHLLRLLQIVARKKEVGVKPCLEYLAAKYCTSFWRSLFVSDDLARSLCSLLSEQ